MHAIAVSRAAPGLYFWTVTRQGHTLVEGDAEGSIEACLRAARPVVETERLVEVAYQGLTMGTVTTQALTEDPVRMASWVEDCMGSLAGALNA